MHQLLSVYSRSLRVKIIAWSFVPASIILTAVALVSFYSYQRVAEDLVVGRNQEVTRLSASQLAGEVEQYADVLVAVTRGADVYRGNPILQRGALAAARNRLVVFDGGVVLIDRAGKVVATEPERPDALGENWGDRRYYTQMLRSPSTVYSDVVADGPNGSNVVVVAVPITDEQNEFQGTLAGMFKLGPAAVSAFYGGIVKLRVGTSGGTYLVDGAGRVIYHTDADQIGADFSGTATVARVLGRESAQGGSGSIGGGDTVTSFAAVPGTPWSLVTEERLDALMSPGEGYRRFLMVLLALGVIIPVLVVMVGVRRITGPLRLLTLASREVAHGSFGRTIDVRTGDELEDLAAQFNAMSAQLKDSYANLERKVADRTRELATLNAIAAVVSGSLKLDEVLNPALEAVLQAMDLPQGGIYLLDQQRRRLTLAVSKGLSARTVAGIAELGLGEGFSGHVAQTGEPLVVTNVPHDPRLLPAAQESGPTSIACVPLDSRGVVLGTLFVVSPNPREFTVQETELLSSIGHQIGVAVENARLFERASQVAVLEERNRLARDLHDSVTQAMYSVTLYAEAASRLLASGNVELATEHVGELRATSQQALREMRSLIFELRPPVLEKEGLVAALQARLEAVEIRAGIAAELAADGVGDIPERVESGLYWIAREALNNALKHARAGTVRVGISRQPDSIMLEVADDGEGFDLEAVRDHHGLGLKGMEERAASIGGRLAVSSAPGRGTTIRAEVEL